MARKKDTPQKAALREMMGNYLKENNVTVKDGTDVNSIMRDMMSIILEGALDQEMDEELGYSKYDYRNKETDNSRNGHSQKTMHPATAIWRLISPTGKESLNHRSSKSIRIRSLRTWKKRFHLHVCQRNDYE